MEYETEPQLPQRNERTWPTRVTGGCLIAFSLVMICSLVSYEHGEMGWDFLNPTGGTAAEEAPCTNWLGLIGLYLAGLCNWLFGAASLYVQALVIIFCTGLVIWPRRPYVLQLVAMLLLVVFACSILAIQPWFLNEWQRAHGLYSLGGLLGYLDGNCLVEPLIGTRWSLVVFLLLHATAWIYFARFTFIRFWKDVWYDLSGLWCRWRENRALRKEQRQKMREEKLRQREEQLARELAAARDAAAADAEVAAAEARRASGDENYLFTDEQQTAAPLPSRQRSSLERRRPVEPAYEEPDYPPVQSFEQQMAESRRREAQRIETQRPPSGRTRHHAPFNTRTRSNLLDLMAPVEEEIALQNAPGADDMPPVPARRTPQANSRLQEQVDRRMANRAPAPAPRPQAAPSSLRATRPAAAPVRGGAGRKGSAAALPKKDTRVQYEDYPLPPYELLKFEPVSQDVTEAAQREMMEVQQRIVDTLDTFKIGVEPGDITRGPSITRYEFYPPRGLRVNRIAALDKDIMMATSSKSVNILAPIPGKNTVGIELENAQKSPVYLRELLQSDNFNSPKLRIPVALGKDVYGNAVIGDLAAMPHTLVAGTTGSGKSVCINSMILSMLYKFRPEELKLILVDPKVVEMQPYRKLPHLICPVVTQPGRVIGALRWAVNEMERRYRLFSQVGVRNFEDFNNREDDGPADEPEEEDDSPIDYAAVEAWASEIERQGEEEVPLEEEKQDEFEFDDPEPIPLKLPYVVIIIDELADLMMVVKEDLENYIARLTQKARAAGIHLVAATQTPRANVVTGTIKANIPSRIAFRVASPLDSRIILDTAGAENLLGKGDSLFLPPGGITKMTRVQGAFVSDAEIAKIIAHCAAHAKQKFEQGVAAEMDNAEGGSPNADNGGRIGTKNMSDEDAELYTRCVQLVVTERKASTSLLQRRFSIGYGRAAKIMDMMEKNGIISPPSGATRAREVLVDA